MPISADEISRGIPVKFYLKTGEVNRGMLYYRKEGPIITADGSFRHDHSEGLQFSFLANSGITRSKKVSSTDVIILKPEAVVELAYSPNRTSRVRMYPPSSGNWLSSVVDSGIDSIFTIQKVKGTKKKLLTITDKTSNELYQVELIQPYESPILTMKRDWNIYT